MRFAILHSTVLIRLRRPFASEFQFLLRGLPMRMTRFGAIGKIAFAVLQMRPAVLHSPLLILLGGSISFAFSIPPPWVVDPDDRRGCYLQDRPYRFISINELFHSSFTAAHSSEEFGLRLHFNSILWMAGFR